MPDSATEPVSNSRNQPFAIHRLGVVMVPNDQDPYEEWGVLNPATARSQNNELFLFPRVVASQNFSRIGIAKVLFSHNGDPVGVERCGYALEPQEPYEFNLQTGGCEDPRVTRVEPLSTYLMTYTAFGSAGSRIAYARSSDLFDWKRLGLATFTTERGVDFNHYNNKDALIFPEAIQDPHGRPALGLIHRPDFNIVTNGGVVTLLPNGVTDPRPGMWISYCPLEEIDPELKILPPFRDHHPLAPPETPWEALKNGGGTVPMKTDLGWLLLFHGVSGVIKPALLRQDSVYYAAGALVLDHDNPQRILYRSSEPILQAEAQDERVGMIDNVVFPTGLDARGNGRVDVYYGMADSRIGVGTLQIPEELPTAQNSSEAVA